MIKREISLALVLLVPSWILTWYLVPIIDSYFFGDKYQLSAELVLSVIFAGTAKALSGIARASVAALVSAKQLEVMGIAGWIGVALSVVGAYYGAKFGLAGIVYALQSHVDTSSLQPCILPQPQRTSSRRVGSAPTARNVRPESSEGQAHAFRSGLLDCTAPILAPLERRFGHREAGHGGPLASQGISTVLALDLQARSGEASYQRGSARAYSSLRGGESLGCAEGSCGAGEARNQSESGSCLSLHAEETSRYEKATELDDVCPQP